MVARGGFTQAMRDLIGDAAEKLDVSTDEARLYPEQYNKNSSQKEMTTSSPAMALTPQSTLGTIGADAFKVPEIKEEPVMEKAAPVTAEEITSTTTISKGTVIKGDIISDGDIELCGSLNGNLKTKGSLRVSGGLIGDAAAQEMTFLNSEVRGSMTCTTEVTIDESSVLYGNVQAESIVLNGKIRGNIKVKKGAVLQDSAVLWGNLEAGSISIDQGAKLEGEVKIIFDKACKDLFDDKISVGGTRPAATATQNTQSTVATAPSATPVSSPVASATAASTASATAQNPALNALRNSINNASAGSKTPFNV
ncbi:bactofilin family protein [Oscillospiraceae bacterium LTW-04]|nr:polymer-forming cytoskeletal protein [Oscillospiraceae bacterium MB24-C1]